MASSSSWSGYITVLFINSSLTITKEIHGTKNGKITDDDVYQQIE